MDKQGIIIKNGNREVILETNVVEPWFNMEGMLGFDLLSLIKEIVQDSLIRKMEELKEEFTC